MTGTILITGANGSLAIHAIHHLLQNYPEHTLLLTVRNSSDSDANTGKLRNAIAQHKGAMYSIRQLDLSSLSAVHDFATTIKAEITNGTLPKLSSIVCNAYFWNLARPVEYSADGFEMTFQVNHISHAALVLRLIDCFAPDAGRVVLFSSDSHWPGRNSLEKYPPAIPQDIELLVKPKSVKKTSDTLGYGMQRYGNSKLAIVMWSYALNRRLEKKPGFQHITVVAVNPGNLSDSRALRTNTPSTLAFMSKFVIQPLRPLLRLKDPTMRTSAEAGHDVAELAANNVFVGERGYFTLLKRDTSSPDSKNEDVQDNLWKKTAEWAGITAENSAIMF